MPEIIMIAITNQSDNFDSSDRNKTFDICFLCSLQNKTKPNSSNNAQSQWHLQFILGNKRKQQQKRFYTNMSSHKVITVSTLLFIFAGTMVIMPYPKLARNITFAKYQKIVNADWSIFGNSIKGVFWN